MSERPRFAAAHGERTLARKTVPRSTVLRDTRRGDEVTVQLDGELLVSERLDGTLGGRERTAEAADIVESARERSAELVREASTHIGEIEQAGFKLGYAEGLQTAAGDLAQALELVQTAAREGKAIRDRIIESAEGELIELVIAALERVIAVRLEQDRELVLETVRRGLDRVGAQRVVRVLREVEVDGKDLGTALKGATAEVQTRVLANMSERAAKMLQDDMATMGPIRLRQVDEAQGRIVAVIRRLEEAEEIFVMRAGEDDLVV